MASLIYLYICTVPCFNFLAKLVLPRDKKLVNLGQAMVEYIEEEVIENKVGRDMILQ